MYSKDYIPNQIAGEKILLFFRRHKVFAFKILFYGLIMILISVLFSWLFFISSFSDNQILSALFILFISIFTLFAVNFTFTNFIDYYLDVWIVTNKRVISIEQKGLFSRQVSEKDLGRMQDITAEVEGFWATIFGYGDVHIQTAGEEQRFIFEQIPNAEEVSRQISNLVAEYRRNHYEYPEKSLKEEENE